MRHFLCSIETCLNLLLLFCRHWHRDSLGEFPDPEARGPVLQPVVRVRPHALLRLLAIRPCRRHPLVRWIESRTHLRWDSPRLKLFYSGIWNQTIWNQETFEIQTFWRLDFKWSLSREGVIIKCPLNGPFHDAHDVILTSRTDVREMVDDDDEWPLVIYLYIDG